MSWVGDKLEVRQPSEEPAGLPLADSPGSLANSRVWASERQAGTLRRSRTAIRSRGRCRLQREGARRVQAPLTVAFPFLLTLNFVLLTSNLPLAVIP